VGHLECHGYYPRTRDEYIVEDRVRKKNNDDDDDDDDDDDLRLLDLPKGIKT
jgi:hypothetical protein